MIDIDSLLTNVIAPCNEGKYIGGTDMFEINLHFCEELFYLESLRQYKISHITCHVSETFARCVLLIPCVCCEAVIINHIMQLHCV